jgi:hypothetical protein
MEKPTKRNRKTIGFKSIRDQGAFAARYQQRQGCPYPSGSTAHREWMEGWASKRPA